MKAVILAGGFGARLKEKTKNIPKPMLKIGGLPILERQINLLKKHGIKEIVILTHYLSEVIEEYFNDGKSFGVKINYFKEKEPLGTAGGLKEIANKLKRDFILLYGDIMLDMDITRLVGFHRKKKGACSLVLHPNDHPQDSDLVEIDDNQKIIAFHSKPHPENKYFHNLVNAGLYVMSPKILNYIKKGMKADFGKDIFPKIIKKDRLYGYTTAEYLKDVGTPSRLSEIRKDYLSRKISRLNRENKRKAIFIDRDGVINRHIEQLCKVEDFHLLGGTAKAVKKINSSKFLAIVITNQPMVAMGLCSLEKLGQIHNKMETLLGKKGAKLDGIYFCPHHPDYGERCNCRKPKIGLVKLAQKDFNIDLKHSYFVGDSWRDILCGNNAGVTTIGVRTGRGCRDIDIKPDYFAKDLLSAVNLVINKKHGIK